MKYIKLFCCLVLEYMEKKIYTVKVLLNNLDVNCIDLLTYDSLIDRRQLDSEGETITSKIRNLFKQYIG